MVMEIPNIVAAVYERRAAAGLGDKRLSGVGDDLVELRCANQL